jgi:putative mRNA 3-end processing factor
VTATETQLLTRTDVGIYCPRGDFHIDPRRPVDRAVITHTHMDHLRRGSREYITARSSVDLIRHRIGRQHRTCGVDFGVQVRLGDVDVSFHPAGHVLGSAQIRVQHGDEVWVVSGDYKRDPDPSCEPFEVVKCDAFVTEATFAHPRFRWRAGEETVREILDWWDENRRLGKVSVLFAYALGKTQRILADLARWTDRPAYVHVEVEPLIACYRRAGMPLLQTIELPRKVRNVRLEGELVIAPPKFVESSWWERFGDVETAFASGWMQNADAAKERGFMRGFALSDHADWDDILRTIEETGARRVFAHHGVTDALVEHLRGLGIEASEL